MKTLSDYIKNSDMIKGNLSDLTLEDETMRKLKKYTQVDLNGEEGLYETTIDRWSRNAKHQLSKSELASASDIVTFEEGENALYDGHTVEIKIPQGPKGTMGIIFEGQLKMVHHTKIKKLDEGVMGGVQTMTPINRIMQLAGLEHTGAVTTDDVSIEENEITTEEVITEADPTGVFKQLIDSVPQQFRDNKEAARLYVIGSLMSVIAKDLQTTPLQTKAGIDKMKSLKLVGPIGADLIKTSETLVKPVATK